MKGDPWDDVDSNKFKESRFSRDSILNFTIPILKEIISFGLVLTILGIIVYFSLLSVLLVFEKVGGIIKPIIIALFIFLIPIILFIDLLTGKIGIWKTFLKELLYTGGTL